MSTTTMLMNAPNEETKFSIEHDRDHGAVFLHVSAGSFSCCLLFDEKKCQEAALAFNKGAFLIDMQTPKCEPAV